MEHPQQSCKLPLSKLEACRENQMTCKNKTLPQSELKQAPEAQKNSKDKGNSNNSTELGKFKLKFNTSQDNLRCFISSNKPQRYRSVSTRLPKQSKSEICLPHTRFHYRASEHQKKVDQCRSHRQRLTEESYDILEDHDQSDLSTILSNQIIHPIEQKGIGYKWNDIQEIKSQSLLSENKDDQLEFQELINAFSDRKTERLSLQENPSTIQSAFTENSVFQEKEEKYEKFDTQAFDPYQKNSNYSQSFDGNYDKNYSFASTMQPYSHLYYQVPMYSMHQEINILSSQNQGGLKSMPSTMFHSNEFIITPQGLGKDPRTTIMIKNIPNKYTIQYLSEEIDQDFGNFYDFLYLPCDTKSGANQGYGFINFTDLDAIKRFYERFHGKKWRRFRSQKICNLTYARLQGIDSLIEHFQNSKVLNHKQKKYQPIIKSLSRVHNLIKQQQINHESEQRN